jgi:hypothetical protein
MNVRQGKREESFDEFGEVRVMVVKIDDMWHIDSVQIRFKNSNYTKWLKLYESFRLDKKNCFSSTTKIEDLLSSPSLEGI